MNQLGTTPPPCGSQGNSNPLYLIRIPLSLVEDWTVEMSEHQKQKEAPDAKSLVSSQETEDHSLPSAKRSSYPVDEVLMEEVEQIPSHSEESLMDTQALAKEARHCAMITKAVGRISGSTSGLQQLLGWTLGACRGECVPGVFPSRPKPILVKCWGIQGGWQLYFGSETAVSPRVCYPAWPLWTR